MPIRQTRGFKEVASGVIKYSDMDIDNNPDDGDGSIPAALRPFITAVETGSGGFHKTVLTLTDLPCAMRDTEQGDGQAIYDFPAGRVARIGATSSIAFTTTSALASTLNTGSTCQYGVGSVTQSNDTLATTEQDFVQVTAFTSSTTVDVAAAATAGVGLMVLAALNGTSTAIQAFLNLAVAGATDIDADATLTASGTITLCWTDLGDT